MPSAAAKWTLVAFLVAIGVALAGAGIYVSEADDAPGAAVIGVALMLGALWLAVRVARRKH